MNKVNDEALATYGNAQMSEDDIITQAMRILDGRIKQAGVTLSDPKTVKQFLRIRLQELEHEEFHVLFLDVKNRVIETKCMFVGTLTAAAVYPREVIKRALAHNAASVIISHNHPSGLSSPSDADYTLTKALKQALALVDIRMLDHIIIAGNDNYSFAEMGDI